MLGREKTSQQDRASDFLKTKLTFESGLWDNILFSFVFFPQSKDPPLWLFKVFLFSKLVSVHLALILLSQAGIYPQSVQLPPNDGNQFTQEIKTSMTSSASSLRLIRSIWTTDKSKRFLPLVPSPEIPLKIYSCLLQSAPQFFLLTLFFSLFLERGSTRGCVCLEVCVGWEWCWSPGLFSFPFYFYFWHH